MKLTPRTLRPVGALVAALALTVAATGCGGDDDDAAPAANDAGEQTVNDAGEQTADDAGEQTANDAGEETDGGSIEGEPASATGTLTAEAQEGDGAAVTVASVEIDGSPGWIALHSDVDGQPGPVLGFVEIEEGSSTDVEVELDEPLTEDATVWPMLHVDDSELGSYEFPGVDGADLPVTEGEMPVMMQIDITVA